MNGHGNNARARVRRGPANIAAPSALLTEPNVDEHGDYLVAIPPRAVLIPT